MKKQLHILSVLLLFLCFGVSHGQTDQLFEQGNQKYAAKKYQEAITPGVRFWMKVTMMLMCILI